MARGIFIVTITMILGSSIAFAQRKEFLDPNKYGDVGDTSQQMTNNSEINSDQLELRKLYSLEAANRYCGADASWTQNDQTELNLLIEAYKKRVDSKVSDKIQRQADINYENFRHNSRRCAAQVKYLFADYIILKSKMLIPTVKAPEINGNNVQTSNSNTSNNVNDFNSVFPSGIYAKTEKDCARYLANPMQMRMNERFERVTIEGREISRYSTGSCTVRNIAGTGPTYAISADCTEEGETSRERYTFSKRDGRYNFGLLDEFGKTWWNLCKAESVTTQTNPKTNRLIGVPGSYPLSSCKGKNGTITELTGQDTKEAVMTGHYSYDDYLEYCQRDPGGETKSNGGRLTLKQCIDQNRKDSQGREPRSVANCEAGQITLMIAEYRKSVRFPLQKNADTSCASGVQPLISQFQIMCPSFAKRYKIEE